VNRAGISILVAVGAGIAAVYLLPPSWLAPLSAVAAVCAAIFAIISRFQTKTEPPADPLGGVLLSVVNLPEQPLAKVKAGWALTTFLVAAAFLVAIGLSVMVRAYA
jgi:hypothetical protein